jgi:hydroxymethylpyrimidine pyrophosphatase-like HAD family hydrolase
MVIAVDFDGTIVTHKYPKIGEEIPFAIESLKLIQKEGRHLLGQSIYHQVHQSHPGVPHLS